MSRCSNPGGGASGVEVGFTLSSGAGGVVVSHDTLRTGGDSCRTVGAGG